VDVAAVDEERARLDAAVKDGDGFFTTFFVSPYSKYIARWAARRGLTPNQVTAVSLVLGLAAAAAFALGSRAGLVAGAVLVQLAFTTDCVDGQLARYARRFSALGAWLDSVFDRVKEYAVYAGLAIGGSGLWVLATAALALQVARHLVDASFTATRSRALRFAPPPLERSADGPAGDGAAAEVPAAWRAAQRVTGGIWLRRIAVFPIGERFAAISLAAAFGSARLALVVLLAGGGLASLYALAGRVLRSLA
jgi:phosphatidylglycerophosphate synthase